MKYFLIIGALIISYVSFSQEYIVIDTVVKEFYYDYNFQQDSTDISSERYQEMILQIGNHSSKFTAVNKLYSDSLLCSVKDLDVTTGFNKIWHKMQGLRTHGFCVYNIYKQYPNEGNVRFIGTLGPKSKLQVDDQIKINWKIEESRDSIILGYSCQKATCRFAGRDYIAWYTMEIPVSDGPYKFQGLPGLIVRIADVNKEHIFQLHKVKNCKLLKEMIYINNEKCKHATPNDFAQAMKAYIADMYRKYGGGASPIQYKNLEQESRTLRNIRTRNNYIERY